MHPPAPPHLFCSLEVDPQRTAFADPVGRAFAERRLLVGAITKLGDPRLCAEDQDLPQGQAIGTERRPQFIERLLDGRRLGYRVAASVGRHAAECNTGVTLRFFGMISR